MRRSLVNIRYYMDSVSLLFNVLSPFCHIHVNFFIVTLTSVLLIVNRILLFRHL